MKPCSVCGKKARDPLAHWRRFHRKLMAKRSGAARHRNALARHSKPNCPVPGHQRDARPYDRLEGERMDGRTPYIGRDGYVWHPKGCLCEGCCRARGDCR